MKTYAICPISDNRINERVARINAVFTILILILFGLTGSVFLILFLAFDFLLRATSYSIFSLVGISSKNIVRYLPFDVLLINAGPKIFAARIGLVLSSLIILANLTGIGWLALGIAGILGLFSFLEAAFGICVACGIYPFVYKLLYDRNKTASIL